MANRQSGISRVLGKLQKCVEEGNYYEALQMYRTLYFRFKNQQKYAEAIDLLYNGAMVMLEHDQHSSVADLSLLLIEALTSSSAEATEPNIEKVGKLYNVMRTDAAERTQYLHQALQWTIKVAPHYQYGHPLLHEKIGIVLWQEHSYDEARYHLLRSHDGVSCAAFLIEIHTSMGFPSEVDLFIAQAVLQCLCLRNKATAKSTFDNYTIQHPQIKQRPPFAKPLLNFIWFLLLAIENRKVTVFSVLCEHYQNSLKRDNSYYEYLDRIGQIFFDIPAPKKQSTGLLGNLMQNLFSGGQSSTSSSGGSATGASSSGVGGAAALAGGLDGLFSSAFEVTEDQNNEAFSSPSTSSNTYSTMTVDDLD